MRLGPARARSGCDTRPLGLARLQDALVVALRALRARRLDHALGPGHARLPRQDREQLLLVLVLRVDALEGPRHLRKEDVRTTAKKVTPYLLGRP